MQTLRVLVWAVAALMFGVSTAAAANEDVLVVYDASDSMWGQIDDANKIVIAREVMADLVNSWPDDTNLGLVAYGHRRAGDCKDIETLIEPGMYEVRYVLREGMRTLASTTVEFVAEDAALDLGASITVTWSGGGAAGSQRITLAKADQADFTWIEAHKANADQSLRFTAPDETGRYEIRFLDVGNMKVLGRATVQVK